MDGKQGEIDQKKTASTEQLEELSPNSFLQVIQGRWKAAGFNSFEELLVFLLASPGVLQAGKAIAVARLAKQQIPRLDLLLGEALKKASSEEAERVLHILDGIADSNRILPLLIPALQAANGRVRSKAARLFGRLCQNATFAESSSRDIDLRVRANALEGLWALNNPLAKSVLLAALQETDNRTMANAALGLFKLGDARGLEALVAMTQRIEPGYRASAAWALGETLDEGCLPMLERLSQDTDPSVRQNAENGINKIRDGSKGKP